MTQPTTLSASSTNHCDTSYPAITRQDASAFAEASSFSLFEAFRPPYLGKINLAVTKYCVPLRLHRQCNIWVSYTSCSFSRHVV